MRTHPVDKLLERHCYKSCCRFVTTCACNAVLRLRQRFMVEKSCTQPICRILLTGRSIRKVKGGGGGGTVKNAHKHKR